MDDWDGPDLGPLTTGVDHLASRELFHARRRRHRRRRRLGAGVVVTLLAFGGALAVAAATGGDGGDRVTTGPPQAESTPVDRLPDAGPGTSQQGPAEVAFRVLDQREARSDQMGQLRSATDTAGLEALWAAIGFEGEAPSVDLDQDLVVSITIPDDACPPELVRFTRDGDQVTPVFEEPDAFCVWPLIPKTYVVAIERTPVSPAFVLHLPGDPNPAYGFGDQDLPVVVDANETGRGPAAVVVELTDVPFFIEGFDYAVRFSGDDGEVLAERRLADFAASPDGGGPPAGASVSESVSVPAGPVVVDSHLTMGIGPGPARPDFENASAAGSLLCPTQDLTLDAGATIRLSLDWETGCLERSS